MTAHLSTHMPTHTLPSVSHHKALPIYTNAGNLLLSFQTVNRKKPFSSLIACVGYFAVMMRTNILKTKVEGLLWELIQLNLGFRDVRIRIIHKMTRYKALPMRLWQTPLLKHA